jgi:hypothetical protein
MGYSILLVQKPSQSWRDGSRNLLPGKQLESAAQIA